MMNPSNSTASTIGKAQTISEIRILSFKAQPWAPGGRQQEKRSVRLEVKAGPVVKGQAQPAGKVAFTIEQWRDAGTRTTAPRGPWSRVELEKDKDLVIFSSSASGRWAEEILPAVTSVCPTPQCLEQVRAGLAADWDALEHSPENSPVWGPLLAEVLVEKTLAFSQDPSLWSRALSLFERASLPVEFRVKSASELFASLALISPLTPEIAQRTMLFGVRLLAMPDGNRGLHHNLLSVYLPKLMSVGDPKALLPSATDRKEAERTLSGMSPTPERDRFLDWLRK